MTREAIKVIEKEPCDVFDKYGNYKYPNDVELTKPNTATSMPCEDTISRQAVIDALHTWFRDGFDEDKWWNSTHVLAAIEGMPSVHQNHKWETCFECPLSRGCPKIKGCTNEQAIEYASKIPNDCPLSAQPERKTDEDAISRQAAIDAVIDLCKYYTPTKSVNHPHMDFVIEALQDLPPVNPTKTGHWIRWYEQKENDWYIDNIPHCKCSECGKEYDPHSSQFIKYCNECGAKMVEPQESEQP